MCYSDSDSEEETPAQQHKILSTSYNFVDYVRSREIQSNEVCYCFALNVNTIITTDCLHLKLLLRL